MAVTVPWDILRALPPQGHSRAASRTNIPIIDKAGSSQRQVLTFSLLLQLLQCLFRGLQAANALPSASLFVHSSCCSLSSHLCRLLVKRETSEWHLCKSRAGMETWRFVEHPESMGEHEWSPQNPPPDDKGRVAKLMAEGSGQGTWGCWRQRPAGDVGDIPASPTSPLPQRSGNSMDISLVPTGQQWDLYQSLLQWMSHPTLSYPKLPFLSGRREKIKMASKKTNLFFMDHGILRISSSVITAPVNRNQVKIPYHSLVIFCSALFFS